MNRTDLVLAALSTGNGQAFRPVQVQKLFFLIDHNIAKLLGGCHFDFKPFNYGPFDAAVYREIEALAAKGLAEVLPEHSWRIYRLTEAGQNAGKTAFNGLPERARRYIQDASEFVRKHGFSTLVSAIYRAYPEMKANSVFQVCH